MPGGPKPIQSKPPTGAGAPAKGTRERILGAAFQLFHEQGYHATGVSTILREAGVNPGSMYHIFPSKDALLLGVLEFALVMMRSAVMDGPEAQTKDPIERVFALLAQYRQGMVMWGCKMGCPIGNLALEVADDNAAARELIHKNFENWANHVRGWLDAAADRLPRRLDRAALARFILTVMEGGLMQARAEGGLRAFDESVHQLRVHFQALEVMAQAERLDDGPAKRGGLRRTSTARARKAHGGKR